MLKGLVTHYHRKNVILVFAVLLVVCLDHGFFGHRVVLCFHFGSQFFLFGRGVYASIEKVLSSQEPTVRKI